MTRPINEIDGTELSAADFNSDIWPSKQPLVMRGLTAQWPIVKCAAKSELDALKYLNQHDNHAPVYTVVGEPSVNGRLFYSDDLADVNFSKTNAAVTAILEQLHAMRENPKPHAVSVQAADIQHCMPSMLRELPMPLLAAHVLPTLWISNRSRVAAHFDLSDNIACVALGKRRFTLFPPSQVSNLYVGPTLNSPGGVPVSMVDTQNVDLQQFPKYETALEHAQTAELNPGDAIFIPSPWWHAVESLDPINALINYWWNPYVSDTGPSAKDSLMLAMLTIAKMDAPQRESWQHLFRYFVFKESGDPAEHLPDSLNDLATQLTTEQKQQTWEYLKSKLDE